MINGGIARLVAEERIDLTDAELDTLSREELDALERTRLPDVEVAVTAGFDAHVAIRYRRCVPCITTID